VRIPGESCSTATGHTLNDTVASSYSRLMEPDKQDPIPLNYSSAGPSKRRRFIILACSLSLIHLFLAVSACLLSPIEALPHATLIFMILMPHLWLGRLLGANAATWLVLLYPLSSIVYGFGLACLITWMRQWRSR
jgi:hypothetical protein